MGDINYTGVIVDVSDRRKKENIEALSSDTLARIGRLQGVSFIMKGDKSRARELGFIAQDVEPIFPELVHTTSDGAKNLNYIGLIAPMVEAIKAQQTAIDQLRADNIRLEALIRDRDARPDLPLPAAVPDRYNR